MLIYKICSRALWDEAEALGSFAGAQIDLVDGFIHFSSAEQVAETLAKHFHGQTDLVIAAIEGDQLGDALKWEESRGGDLFPHLYESLPMSAVVRVQPIVDLPDGGHQLPPDFA